MYNYCVANPKGFGGYGAKNWGLNASYDRNADGSIGYLAHQPANDDGVISPTAALSSLPYTPTKSMNLLRFIYNENFSKYVGVCGPYDAYSVHYIGLRRGIWRSTREPLPRWQRIIEPSSCGIYS